jgi:hypothetical protein
MPLLPGSPGMRKPETDLPTPEEMAPEMPWVMMLGPVPAGGASGGAALGAAAGGAEVAPGPGGLPARPKGLRGRVLLGSSAGSLSSPG